MKKKKRAKLEGLDVEPNFHLTDIFFGLGEKRPTVFLVERFRKK